MCTDAQSVSAPWAAHSRMGLLRWREQGKAHIWSVDGHDDIKRLFNVTTGNIHSIAFDPESTQSSQGMPDKMLLGDDHGKMTMINLKEAQFGNQMGVLDARGFGAGCVRHVSPHKHPLVAPPLSLRAHFGTSEYLLPDSVVIPAGAAAPTATLILPRIKLACKI